MASFVGADASGSFGILPGRCALHDRAGLRPVALSHARRTRGNTWPAREPCCSFADDELFAEHPALPARRRITGAYPALLAGPTGAGRGGAGGSQGQSATAGAGAVSGACASSTGGRHERRKVAPGRGAGTRERLKQAERGRRSLLAQTVFLGSLSVLFLAAAAGRGLSRALAGQPGRGLHRCAGR
ncbi:MAG: hypothetical protein MZW92_46925 [Comamonadaceae bacterium]|nr:hypothetical protein [Comamonadaceae bacterium]